MDELSGQIDWRPITALLNPIHASAGSHPVRGGDRATKGESGLGEDRHDHRRHHHRVRQRRRDDARWVKHKGKPAVHGFKAHVGADADTVLIEEVAVTPANINDGRAGPDALPDALPDAPGEVFADSAYRGAHFREAGAKGGTPHIAVTGMWGSDEQQTLAG